MKLPRLITFSGWDDSCGVPEIRSVVDQHLGLDGGAVAVELGVLYSRDRQGTPRYPGPRSIGRFTSFVGDMMSLHLCGAVVREALRYGTVPRVVELNVGRIQRFQFNLRFDDYGFIRQDRLSELAGSLAELFGSSFVFTWHESVADIYRGMAEHGLDCSPLCDRSGGHGVLPDFWPSPATMGVVGTESLVGYAGGLNRDNIRQQLPRIAEAAGDNPYWIDLETGCLGDDGLFSPERCVEIYNIVREMG